MLSAATYRLRRSEAVSLRQFASAAAVIVAAAGTALLLLVIRSTDILIYHTTGRQLLHIWYDLGLFSLLPLSAVSSYLVAQLSVSRAVESADVAEVARAVLESEGFRTSLREVVPADDPPEFSDVPGMARLLEDHRERHRRSASAYLKATVALALLFATVVVSLGYFVIVEESAGTPRLLRLLDGRVGQMTELATQLVSSDRAEFSALQAAIQEVSNDINDSWPERERVFVEASLARLARIEPDDPASILDAVKRDIAQYPRMPRRRATPDGLLGLRYIRELANTAATSDAGLRSNLAVAATDFRSQLAAVRAAESANRTAELLKRVFVGLIVVAFFVMILRYLARLHDKHHQEVLWADQNALAIRRFRMTHRAASSAETKDLAIRILLDAEAPGPEPADKSPAREAVLAELARFLSSKI